MTIANRLLDDGADATVITPSEHVNVLQLLSSQGDHDFALEVPLLEAAA